MQEILEFLSLTPDDIKRLIAIIKFAFVIYASGLVLEYFNQAEKNQPLENIRFNLIYSVNFVVVNAIVFGMFKPIIAPTIDLLGGPYFQWTFGSSVFSQILYALTFLFIFDFFYYWFHRWQHTSRLFWAQHQFHHSDESLNVTTSNRHHWLEDVFRIFVILIPMGTLVKLDAKTTTWIWSSLMLWGYFIHLNIKMNMGILTPIIGGPQVHRIHHSFEKDHLDKNFAAFFPIFDIIFGTFYYPKKHEYPKTGLLGGYKMNSFKKANFYPFMYWIRRIKKLASRQN